MRPLVLLVVPIAVVLGTGLVLVAPAAVRCRSTWSMRPIVRCSSPAWSPAVFPLPGRDGDDLRRRNVARRHEVQAHVRRERAARTTTARSQINIITAQHGELYHDTSGGDRFLALKDGFRVEGTPGSGRFPPDALRAQRHQAARQRADDNSDAVKRSGADRAKLWRSDEPCSAPNCTGDCAAPLSALVLALLALPLSRSSPRQPRYAQSDHRGARLHRLCKFPCARPLVDGQGKLSHRSSDSGGCICRPSLIALVADLAQPALAPRTHGRAGWHESGQLACSSSVDSQLRRACRCCARGRADLVRAGRLRRIHDFRRRAQRCRSRQLHADQGGELHAADRAAALLRDVRLRRADRRPARPRRPCRHRRTDRAARGGHVQIAHLRFGRAWR